MKLKQFLFFLILSISINSCSILLDPIGEMSDDGSGSQMKRSEAFQEVYMVIALKMAVCNGNFNPPLIFDSTSQCNGTLDTKRSCKSESKYVDKDLVDACKGMIFDIGCGESGIKLIAARGFCEGFLETSGFF